tara:strand:- start:396 stop:596 length:201 start_codon:yes stop_codon:yes gene_type:complete
MEVSNNPYVNIEFAKTYGELPDEYNISARPAYSNFTVEGMSTTWKVGIGLTALALVGLTIYLVRKK